MMIKRDIDFAIWTGEPVPDYITERIITTMDKLDEDLAKKHDEVIERYGVTPEQVEVLKVHVISFWGTGKHHTPLSHRNPHTNPFK